MAEQDDVATEIVRRFDEAETNRVNWRSHWKEIAERVLPSYATSFDTYGIGNATQGEKRTAEMFDSTAAQALVKFASIMESMLTPRGSEWHRMRPSDRTLMRNKQVRFYFDDVNQILWDERYKQKANYASQKNEIYMGLGAFGTGCLFIDARDGGGLRYRANHLSEVVFLENHQNIIDTVIRKFELSARQAVQKWGEDKLPEKITQAAKGPKPETKFWFMHCVKPRTDQMYGRRDYRGMPFSSHYVAVADKQVVEEGGYNTFPYAISRYVVAPGELYGRSPAMLVLPNVKVLNEIKKTTLKQGHRAVDPILLAHDDGIVDAFSWEPGSIVAGGVDAQGRPLVHAVQTGNLQVADKMMDAERHDIKEAFFVNLFQILTENPQMTATEVMERVREKGVLLSPTMGRQQTELLDPMIERELDILSKQGKLPPKPQFLLDADYEVEYDSPLSRAQKAEKASGFMQWVNWSMEFVKATQDPSPLDHINFDAAQPELADIRAVPARWINDMETIKTIREGRSQMRDAQMAVDAAPALSGMMKNAQPA